MSKRVLLVDNDPQAVNALINSLVGEPFEIYHATSADEAIDILETEDMDVVISGDRIPGTSATQLLATVAREYPEIARILLTARPSIEMAIEAVNEGQICRFLVKPWNDIELETAIRGALEFRQLHLKILHYKTLASDRLAEPSKEKEETMSHFKIEPKTPAKERPPTVRYGCQRRVRVGRSTTKNLFH